MAACILMVTADQLHKFLRMHFMTVRVGSILLWHRARAAVIGDHWLFFSEVLLAPSPRLKESWKAAPSLRRFD